MPETRNKKCLAVRTSVAVLLPLSIFVQGCSHVTTDVQREKTATRSPVAASPEVGRSKISKLRLPIEDYLFSTDESRVLERAISVMTSLCMKNLGYSYREMPTQSIGPVSLTDRRYGITDTQTAKAYGYHLPGAVVAKQPSLSQDEQDVLDGKSRASKSNGEAVPHGGCREVANRSLGVEGINGASNIALEINIESYKVSRVDPKVKAAGREWSACMRTSGLDYQDPLTAANDPKFSGPSPEASERNVALDDIKCKEQVRFAEIWFGVEEEYQRGVIAANLRELKGAKKNKETQLAAAQKILAVD
ncbi:hypothetical protein ACFVDT_26940 [Streptomyces sp. NPDC057699]|uniref:hypothetical protein n=1 Tax=Streptomyces sp. NPDC057699 TaxID=3346220 RepID=UPI0036A674E9